MRFWFFILCFLSITTHAEINLNDLGIDPQASPNTPTLTPSEFSVRTKKLKRHEVLGLVTLGTMTATMFTGGSAMDNDLHMYLGIATGALYAATAYYAFTAPKPSGVIDKGRIKWHKTLAWIHLPAMIIAPYLGYMYKKHEEDGQKHTGLEKHHSTVAGILYGSFALSATLMVLEF